MAPRSEEHTSELQSHSGISYAVFCLKKKKKEVSQENTLNARIRLQPHQTRQHVRDGNDSHVSFTCPSFALQQKFFFFNVAATTEIYTPLYTLSLHDALPISAGGARPRAGSGPARAAPDHS